MVGTSVAVFWTSDTVYAVVLGAGAWLVWLRSGRRLRQGALTSAD